MPHEKSFFSRGIRWKSRSILAMTNVAESQAPWGEFILMFMISRGPIDKIGSLNDMIINVIPVHKTMVIER